MSKKQKHRLAASVSAAPPPAPSFNWRGTLLAAGVLLAAGAAIYANSFAGVFHLDDNYHIVDNTEIRTFWPPWDWLCGPRGISRPVIAGTLALNYSISALAPWSYHALNLAVHLCAALALFGIVRRTLCAPKLRPQFGGAATPLAFVVALLWMAHPLQTQAVTYIIQRCESMMGLFFLLTLYCAIRAFGSARRRALWMAASVAGCIMGAGCKQVIVGAPVLVFVYDAIFVSGSVAGALARWKFYALLCVSWIVVGVILAIMPPAQTAGFALPTCSPAQYALTQPGVLLHYLRLVFWPDTLCFDYGWRPAASAGEVLPGVLCIGGLFALTLWSLVRAPAWGFAGAWFFVILAPTSSIMPINDLAVEHRMYLPLAALITVLVCAAWLGGGALRRVEGAVRFAGWLPVILAGALVLPLGYRTVLRNADYASASGLLKLTTAQRPQNHQAFNKLGVVLAREQKQGEAIVYFQKAIEINPRYTDAYGNIGNALYELHRYDEAIPLFRQALSISPDYPQGHANLGAVLATKGLFDEALAEFHEALRLKPDFLPAKQNMDKVLKLKAASAR